MTLGELRNTLNQVRARILNSTPAYRAISDLMVSSAQMNFEDEGRPTKWAPLAPATKKLKDKHGWTTILIRSGRLRASITGKGADTSATIGSNLAYAKIQNDGGSIAFPARERKLRFRQTAGGSLMSQADLGMGPHHRNAGKMVVFAKGKHKRALEMTFTGRAYTATMPARPYLLIQSEDVDRYNTILRDYWFKGVMGRIAK